jgi:hypothetical protein
MRYDSGVTQPLTSPPNQSGPDQVPAGGRRAADPLTAVRARERYAILGEHGRGALGRVSRAHDTELGRDVAIK